MFCHMDDFDSTKLTIFGLIQIWECALNWFTMKSAHKPKFDICHLYGLGQHILNMFFCWFLLCKWFPIDLKICVTFKCSIFQTLPLGFLLGHVLVGVNPCGRCTVMTHVPQIAKLPKKSQNDSFKICELIWVGVLLLFWIRVRYCHLKMIWMGFNPKLTPICFLNCCPPRSLLTFL